jgi:twinfilin
MAVFIYSCPASSSIKQRMVYASSRRAIPMVASEMGLKVDTKIETSEVDELTLKFLTKEIHGVEVVEEKKTFARPRGPPRRAQKVAETESANGESGTD